MWGGSEGLIWLWIETYIDIDLRGGSGLSRWICGADVALE